MLFYLWNSSSIECLSHLMSVSGVEENEIDVLEHFWVSETCRPVGQWGSSRRTAEQPQGSGQLSGSSVVAQCDLCLFVCVQQLQIFSFLMRNRSQNPWGWCESHCFSNSCMRRRRTRFTQACVNSVACKYRQHCIRKVIPPLSCSAAGEVECLLTISGWTAYVISGAIARGRERPCCGTGREPDCCLPLLQKCLLWVKRVSNAKF